MKKIKLMSLLTALLLVLGFTTHRANAAPPTPTPNYFTRPACLPPYLGCSPNTLYVRYSIVSSGFSPTEQAFTSNSSFGIQGILLFAAVSMDGGVTYTSYQRLPTSVADPILFTINAPTNPYLISISMTSANNFSIGVSQNAL